MSDLGAAYPSWRMIDDHIFDVRDVKGAMKNGNGATIYFRETDRTLETNLSIQQVFDILRNKASNEKKPRSRFGDDDYVSPFGS